MEENVMKIVAICMILACVASVACAQTAARRRSHDAVAPGLDALIERRGVKPYDLFWRGDALMTHRVIFRDLSFGTPVWMLDFSPTVDHSDTASVWSPWNPDGSTLYIGGARPQADEPGLRHGWFFDAGFSRLRPGPPVPETGPRVSSRPAVWSPENTDLYYGPINPGNRIVRTNWRTGEQEVVAQWEPMTWAQSGQRIYGLTGDGRHIFVDTPNRGIWVPFQPHEDAPIPRLRMYDGRPVFPDGTIQGSENRFSVCRHRRYGDMIGLRTGLLIDRETGEITNIAAPLCGNVNYLRAFHEGRVRYPRDEEWDAYGLPGFRGNVRLPEGLSMNELRELWLNLPHATHGHESMSPDREYIAVDAGSLIQRVRDGVTRRFRVTSDGENYHLHWQRHPRFFVSWVRGWRMSYGRATGREFTSVNNANIEFQVFCDGTVQPVVNTHHRFNAYYAGGDFSMLSPDATKIHYGSSMTGRFRNYIAVMARPRPPLDVSWQADDVAVALSWRPSEYSRETRGYLIYRGDASGGPYSLMTLEPVEATTWRDETIAPGRPYYYVVTSIEHSGLESGYSAEAAYAGIGLPEVPDAPLVVYAEAESPLFDLRTGELTGLAAGADRSGASDWYYLYRHPDVRDGAGAVKLTVNIPAAGDYRLWARMRAEGANAGRWAVAVNGLTHTLSVSDTEWTWIRADGEGVSLPAGRVTLTLATADAGAQMDLLCLSTSADFVPKGPRPENMTPPAAPSQLQAENVRERVNRLVWEETSDPGFSHYQVYASREAADFDPDQAALIGSPTQAEFIDWGLRAGTRYYYAVTAVDRRGNESAPVRTDAAVPPRVAPPFEKELAFVDADLTGEFERAAAAGLRASQYVVPRQPGINRAVWKVKIPGEGPYYLWLRHLLRGTGSRGADVRQEIRALVNGKHVFTLGGGLTDINAPDSFIAGGHPLAEQLWTWAWPGAANLEPVMLPAGEIELALENFPENVRYDVLLITDEPSYVPRDGRLRQR